MSKRVLSAQPRYQPIRIDDIMAKAGTLTWVLSFISIKFYKVDYLILKSIRITQCNSKNSKQRRSWDALCFHLPLHRMFSFQEFELVHFASISEILRGWENKEVCSTYVPTNNLRIYGKWKMIAKRRKTTQQCVARKKGNQNNPEKYTSSANKILSLCLVYRHHYVLKHSRILIEIKCVENSMFFKAAFTKRFVSKAKA